MQRYPMNIPLTIVLSTVVILLSTIFVEGQKKGAPLFTGEFGIAPYTFRKSFPNGVAETLDTIQSMGFTEIEGGGGGMDAIEYKKLCDERGLSIPSMGTGYKRLVENTQEVIDRAEIYQSRYIMCAWIPHETGNFNFDNAKKAVEDFNRVGKILKENGLTLCYHAHGYEFREHHGGTLLDYMMEQTDPEYVSYEMDIFWIQFGGGNPVKLLDKYGDRWKLMHIKDMKKGIKKDLTGLTDNENDVTVGTGQVDIEGVLRAAKKVGIKHYFIEDESSRIITQIPQSISYIKSLRH